MKELNKEQKAMTLKYMELHTLGTLTLAAKQCTDKMPDIIIDLINELDEAIEVEIDKIST